jgi:putative MATE family efflux protein
MLQTRVSNKQILQLALPIYGGLIASQSIIIADIYFLGHVDSVQQSAAAFAGVFYTVFFLIGYGFTQGTQILIARRIGEGKLAEVGKLFWNTMFIGLVYSIAVALFFRFFTGPLFSWLMESQEVAKHASEYMATRSFGFLGTQMAWCFCAYNIGRGNSMAVTIASGTNAIINILLAYLFIFGGWGIPKMEIKGAALASGIADLCCALVYIIYSFLNKDYLQYNIQKVVFFTREHVLQLFKVSFPLIIQCSLSIVAWFLFFAWIEKTGKINFEVSMIIRGIYSVFLMSPIALSSATNSLVSNLIGQKRENEVIALVYKVIKLSFFYVLIVAPILIFMPDFLMSIFTQDPALIAFGKRPLITVFIAMLFFSISSIFFQSVSGTGNTVVALVIESICIAMYLLYAAMATIWGDPYPLWVIWMAEVFYMLSFGVFSAIYLHSGRWKQIRI